MTNKAANVENVVIIGGGPAGLAVALYTARANLSPFVLAGAPPGGQLMLTSDVENYPGFESILGPELIQKYREHVLKFNTRIKDENVVNIDTKTKLFTVHLESGNTVQSRAIVVATGAKALWLGLENETKLRGRGVSACATCDGFFFKEKIVVVVGGGDTAMEEALTLAKFASKVYVIHRRDAFRASKIMQDRVLAHEKIEVLWDTVVIDVLGEQKVEGVKARNSKTNEEKTIEAQGMFLAIGHKPDTDFLKGSGVELDEKGYIYTTQRVAWEMIKSQAPNRKQILNSNLENSKLFDTWNLDFVNYQYMTSVEGVFAAGDCVDYIYRQAGTAVGMGIAAALETERWLETT